MDEETGVDEMLDGIEAVDMSVVEDEKTKACEALKRCWLASVGVCGSAFCHKTGILKASDDVAVEAAFKVMHPRGVRGHQRWVCDGLLASRASAEVSYKGGQAVRGASTGRRHRGRDRSSVCSGQCC